MTLRNQFLFFEYLRETFCGRALGYLEPAPSEKNEQQLISSYGNASPF